MALPGESVAKAVGVTDPQTARWIGYGLLALQVWIIARDVSRLRRRR